MATINKNTHPVVHIRIDSDIFAKLRAICMREARPLNQVGRLALKEIAARGYTVTPRDKE